VWGWTRQPEARGRAMTTVFDMTAIDPNEPIPDGMVWNIRYRDGRAKAPPVRVTDEEIWDRLAFLCRNLCNSARKPPVPYLHRSSAP
jgi:mannonate dehydratase